eukprot:1150034-Pelagomonas_calceolata.AAC.9
MDSKYVRTPGVALIIHLAFNPAMTAPIAMTAHLFSSSSSQVWVPSSCPDAAEQPSLYALCRAWQRPGLVSKPEKVCENAQLLPAILPSLRDEGNLETYLGQVHSALAYQLLHVLNPASAGIHSTAGVHQVANPEPPQHLLPAPAPRSVPFPEGIPEPPKYQENFTVTNENYDAQSEQHALFECMHPQLCSH